VVKVDCSGPRRPMMTTSTPRRAAAPARGRRCRCCQDVRIGHQDPATSSATLPLPTTTARSGQIGRHLLEMRVGVVPAHEVDRRHAARQILPGDVQRPVGLRADRVDDGVVRSASSSPACRPTAMLPKNRNRGSNAVFSNCLADRLDLRVVRRHAGTHQDPTGWAASPACRRECPAPAVRRPNRRRTSAAKPPQYPEGPAPTIATK
jgi:hypothetical protein